MTTMNLQDRLQSHEIARFSGKNFESRYFDTEQSITRIRTKITVKPENAPERTEDTITEVVRDNRAGDIWVKHARGGHGGGGHQLSLGYPELTAFVDSLEEQCRGTHRVRCGILDTAMGVIAAAMGHGNIHPLALLHPSIIMSTIKSVTIGHRKAHYDLQALRQRFAARGMIIESADPLAEGKDETIAYIGMPNFSHESPRQAVCMHAYVFNPKNIERAKAGHDQTFPDADNRFFDLFICCEHEYSQRRTSPTTVRYHAWDYSKHGQELLEREIYNQAPGGFYIRVDPVLVEQLVRLAPLPINKSDCGSDWNINGLEKEHRNVRLSEPGDSRRIALAELEKCNAEAREFLEREDGWLRLKNPAEIDSIISNEPPGTGANFVLRSEYPESKTASLKRVEGDLGLKVRHLLDTEDLKDQWVRQRYSYVWIDTRFHQGWMFGGKRRDNFL